MSIYVWIAWSVGMVIVWGVVPALVVFFVVRAVRRRGVRGAARRRKVRGAPLAVGIGQGRLTKGVSWFVGTVLEVVGDASAAKEESGGNIFATPFDRPEQLFGSYNYRTHKTDDGLDPVGWYYDSEPMFGGSENRDKHGN